jgi:hypothetical protein
MPVSKTRHKGLVGAVRDTGPDVRTDEIFA